MLPFCPAIAVGPHDGGRRRRGENAAKGGDQPVVDGFDGNARRRSDGTLLEFEDEDVAVDLATQLPKRSVSVVSA